MESKINQEVISLNELLYNGNTECPIDMEFSLPDYCPDIKRILKCRAKPCILTSRINGDVLEVSGVTKINVLYVDEDSGDIASCEMSDEFMTPIRLTEIPDMPKISVKTQMGYVNCRASSSRKLDIHGSFGIIVKIDGLISQNIITDAEGDGIQIKTENCQISSTVGFADKTFTISEVLELPQAKPPILSILRSSAVCCFAESKTIQNKVIIKGDLNICMLYQPDSDEEIQQMQFSLPVSQIVDVDGVEETSVCDVRLKSLTVELKPMTDANNEMKLISSEVKVRANVNCYAPMELKLITDAFSTEYELDCERKTVPTELICDIIKTEETLRILSSLPPDGIIKIADVWCDEPVYKCRQGEDCLIFDITIRLCLLGYNPDGVPVYFEKELEGEYSYEIKEQGRLCCDADFTIADVSYSMTGDGKLDLRLLMKINGVICRNDSHSVICSMSPDEQRKKAKIPNRALSLYFADAGEEVWDIAKRYNTSCKCICEENDISGEAVDGGMVVVPLIQAF